MNSSFHIAAGIGFALVAATVLTPFGLGASISLQLIAIACLGALLPDVDHYKTKQFKFVAAVVFATIAILCWQLTANALLSLTVGATAVIVLLALKPRHRGITHSWPAAIVFAVIVYAATLDKGLALAGLAAYASHLVLDLT
ncbi:hypothetical protein AUJ65_02300 [Candidatus Micrarchaeota archaeon CG1_02_51_15]|nr:MAG: hypothetical protein AUJ65_02300 [Candidatus Micrarchaeota archaeon CG1_02_51_15]